MTLMQNPSHPGEVLSELYLEPLGMGPIALAKRLHVPRTRIERLVKGDTTLTVDTAVRLARFFRTTPDYWMNPCLSGCYPHPLNVGWVHSPE